MNHYAAYRIILFLIVVSQGHNALTQDIAHFSTFPFPSELVSSPDGEMLAWALAEEGKRNVYVAKAPDFSATKLTDFEEDDGQEITSLQLMIGM